METRTVLLDRMETRDATFGDLEKATGGLPAALLAAFAHGYHALTPTVAALVARAVGLGWRELFPEVRDRIASIDPAEPGSWRSLAASDGGRAACAGAGLELEDRAHVPWIRMRSGRASRYPMTSADARRLQRALQHQAADRAGVFVCTSRARRVAIRLGAVAFVRYDTRAEAATRCDGVRETDVRVVFRDAPAPQKVSVGAVPDRAVGTRPPAARLLGAFEGQPAAGAATRTLTSADGVDWSLRVDALEELAVPMALLVEGFEPTADLVASPPSPRPEACAERAAWQRAVDPVPLPAPDAPAHLTNAPALERSRERVRALRRAVVT